MVKEFETSKLIHFGLYILPLLLLAAAFFYFAPALEWVSVTGGSPRNPFAQRQVSGLVFSIRTMVGLTWLFCGVLSAIVFVYETNCFFAGHNEKKLTAVFVTIIYAALTLFTNIISTLMISEIILCTI